MKTTYVSCCIDTGVSQLNKLGLSLFGVFGFLFAVLPPPIPGLLLVAVCAILTLKGTLLYRHYQSQYEKLSAEGKEKVSLYFEKHHHARTLFILPFKCLLLGFVVHLSTEMLLV